MSKILKVLKGILLYATILYFCLFIMAADSLGEIGIDAVCISFGILIALIVLCAIAFKNDSIENYIPRCLK